MMACRILLRPVATAPRLHPQLCPIAELQSDTSHLVISAGALYVASSSDRPPFFLFYLGLISCHYTTYISATGNTSTSDLKTVRASLGQEPYPIAGWICEARWMPFRFLFPSLSHGLRFRPLHTIHPDCWRRQFRFSIAYVHRNRSWGF